MESSLYVYSTNDKRVTDDLTSIIIPNMIGTVTNHSQSKPVGGLETSGTYPSMNILTENVSTIRSTR